MEFTRITNTNRMPPNSFGGRVTEGDRCSHSSVRFLEHVSVFPVLSVVYNFSDRFLER